MILKKVMSLISQYPGDGASIGIIDLDLPPAPEIDSIPQLVKTVTISKLLVLYIWRRLKLQALGLLGDFPKEEGRLDIKGRGRGREGNTRGTFPKTQKQIGTRNTKH